MKLRAKKDTQIFDTQWMHKGDKIEIEVEDFEIEADSLWCDFEIHAKLGKCDLCGRVLSGGDCLECSKPVDMSWILIEEKDNPYYHDPIWGLIDSENKYGYAGMMHEDVDEALDFAERWIIDFYEER